MSEDSNLELPLLTLFDRLQKAGLPLGIDEYTIALRAIQSGYGIQNYESLARLCQTLWVKSEEEKLLFNYHFQQVMDEVAVPLEPIPISSEEVQPQPKKLPFNLSGLSKTHWLLLGGSLLLTGGVFVWQFITQTPRKCPYFTSLPPSRSVRVEQPYTGEVKVCQVNKNDKLEIKATQKPSWLEVKKVGDKLVNLTGKPKYKTYISVNLWDLSGQRLRKFQSHINPRITFTLLVVSNNDLYIATTETNKEVSLWSLYDNKTSKKFLHSGIVNDIRFSPNSQRLATASGDGFVYLRDLSGKLLGKLKHKRRVEKVIFSPDGEKIVTVSDDNMHRLWDLSGQLIAELGKSNGHFVDFSDDGQRLITIPYSTTRSIKLWDRSGKEIKTKLRLPSTLNLVALSPDGNKLAIAAYYDRVMLLDLESGNKQAEIRQADVKSIDFSKNGQNVLVASTSDRIVRLWQPYQDPTGKQVKKLRHQGTVEDATFSPDGNLIATASSDRIARLWNLSARELKKLPHDGEVSTIQFSPDGKHLITTSNDNVHDVELQLTDASGNIKDTQAFKINILPPIPDIQKQINFLAITGCITFLLWSGGYVVARYWLEQIAKSKLEDITPESETTAKTTPLTPKQQAQPEDALQVVRAVRQANAIETGEYFPVTRRQMKQSWRYLRRFVRNGPPTELDIEGTVNDFAREGILLQPALRPRRVNRAELLLLIDRDGSMMPFHELSSRLVETAAQGGRLAKADVYYFHNCVDRYIYQDPSCCEAELLVDVLTDYSNNAGVMIFSDAGAARGGWNQERIDLTKQFLEQLQQRIRYITWLNPMPKSRWEVTTAGEIASLVPMFELSRQGLQGAIGVLRGKFTPHGL